MRSVRSKVPIWRESEARETLKIALTGVYRRLRPGTRSGVGRWFTLPQRMVASRLAAKRATSCAATSALRRRRDAGDA